MHKAKP